MATATSYRRTPKTPPPFTLSAEVKRDDAHQPELFNAAADYDGIEDLRGRRNQRPIDFHD